MDQDATQDFETSPAAHAFDDLRAEISLLRRAVERLADERSEQPDYAPSLEAITKRLEDVCTWARRVSERPALQLTPDALVREIDAAAATSREQDRQMLVRAAEGMSTAIGRVDAMLARVRSAADQQRELRRNRVAFAIAGIVTFAILPGVVARSLPVSWALPERMAARMLGRDMWHAGQTMMAKADPKRWQRVVARQREKPPKR